MSSSYLGGLKMTIKEDLLRASEYGKTEYYRAIKEVPSYQKELERTRTDFKGRSWIESPFKLPKFTTDEFEAKRKQYQEKYGTVVNIPGFNDIIHLKLPVKLTAEEIAAHKFALARGLPSPLSTEQLQALQGRKYRFLKSLAVPTPEWLRQYGIMSNFLDNTEDALVTAVVLGRLLVKFAPRVFKGIIPGLGWLLLGSDIINMTNTIGMITFAANGKKRIIEDLAHDNPFHAKAAARRTRKLGRSFPTFGEWLEVLQTTDQLFGVGLCLGPLMGTIVDAASWSTGKLFSMGLKAFNIVSNPTEEQKFYGEVLKYGPMVGNAIANLTPEDVINSLLRFNTAIEKVWPWWVQNDPISNVLGLNNLILEPPSKVSPLTRRSDKGSKYKTRAFRLVARYK
jgi:hypothetical protein